MSTGIDPTGGELGPDFDPDTGRPLDEYQEEEPEQWQEEAKAGQFVYIRHLPWELRFLRLHNSQIL